MANVTQGVGGGLHLLAVRINGEITLGHGVELVAEEDGAGSLVRLKESVDGDPKL